MLFLLRKVRRKLMNENKFTTYFLYAIGEILLVVIGILIAVKIDSLNQEQQKQEQQKQYYNGIIIDLKRDSVHFEQLRVAFREHLNSYYIIYDGIKDESKYVSASAVELMMYNRTFAPVTQKNHQVTIDKISNIEVRAQLNDYFASQELTKEGFDEFNENIVGLSRPFILEMNVLNYDSVFHDDKYGFLPSVPLIKEDQIPSLLKQKRTLQILSFLRISGGLVISDLKKLQRKNAELIKNLTTRKN